MADHHKAKDGSKRNTYTHCLGHDLEEGNTGKMQWGNEYKEKHENIYRDIVPLLKDGGLFILNVSNHIRCGEEIKVSEWHLSILVSLGLKLEKDKHIATHRNKFGANADKRVEYEHIYVLRKL